MGRANCLIVSCEHGGNDVPSEFAELFRGRKRLLASHRGFDPGTLELATICARRLKAPLVVSTVTRLLVDLNRSPGHRAQFSELTRELPDQTRQDIVARYYLPHRRRVESLAQRAIRGGTVAIHVSVHSFTPVRNGRQRRADVGLLYDPSRAAERNFCDRWLAALGERRPDLRLRRNYPYRGVADGLTTWLRKRLPANQYAGIELEVNQRWPRRGSRAWQKLMENIAKSLAVALSEP